VALTEHLLDEIYYYFLLRNSHEQGLSAIANMLDANAGAIIIVEDGTPSMATTYNIAMDSFSRYQADLHRQDPIHPLIQAGKGPVIHLLANSDSREYERSDYYQYMHKPSDIHDVLCLDIHLPDKTIGISLTRPKGEMFLGKDVELAKEILPHLNRAFRLLSVKRSEGADHQGWRDRFGFTDKETAIVELIHKGKSYAEICSMLSISNNTIKWHLKNVFQKTSVNKLAALIAKTGKYD